MSQVFWRQEACHRKGQGPRAKDVQAPYAVIIVIIRCSGPRRLARLKKCKGQATRRRAQVGLRHCLAGSPFTPLPLAGFSVMVSVHLDARAVLEEKTCLSAGCHLGAVGSAIATVFWALRLRAPVVGYVRRQCLAVRLLRRVMVVELQRSSAHGNGDGNGHGGAEQSAAAPGTMRLSSSGRSSGLPRFSWLQAGNLDRALLAVLVGTDLE
jgi:hypothetical protein